MSNVPVEGGAFAASTDSLQTACPYLDDSALLSMVQELLNDEDEGQPSESSISACNVARHPDSPNSLSFQYSNQIAQEPCSPYKRRRMAFDLA